jgi:hypothetical protein
LRLSLSETVDSRRDLFFGQVFRNPVLDREFADHQSRQNLVCVQSFQRRAMNPSPSAEIVENYLKLLLAFRAVPETKRSRTFMQVSGYPHYENVCTNILKFYFNPSAEHGLENLLLCAFLKVVGIKELPPLNDVSVDTRQGTEGGNSIDLVIDSPAFTIGIENKIFHWLAKTSKTTESSLTG